MGKLLLAAALAAAVGVLALNHRRAEAAEGRLAEIAGQIAQRDVNVHCQGAIGEAFDIRAEAGYVEFDAAGRPADTATLKRGVCGRLAGFAAQQARPESACLDRDERCPPAVLKSAWAAHTLAHEAWHLAGYQDEAATECYALQSTAWVAERLGASPARAQALARYLFVHVYPGMPDSYRSSECRDGGALDLRRASAVWP